MNIDLLLKNIVSINPDIILYHGNVNISNPGVLNEKYLWTSIVKEQSTYHTFSGQCHRYRELYKKDADLWPMLYILRPKGNLNMLFIYLLRGEYYIVDAEGNNINMSEYFKMKPGQYITNYNCESDNFSGDCNIKVLEYINYLNETGILGIELSGYICINDQSEYAFVNYKNYLDVIGIQMLTITPDILKGSKVILTIKFSKYLEIISKFIKDIGLRINFNTLKELKEKLSGDISYDITKLCELYNITRKDEKKQLTDMIYLHSIIYPETELSLDFPPSVYTNIYINYLCKKIDTNYMKYINNENAYEYSMMELFTDNINLTYNSIMNTE